MFVPDFLRSPSIFASTSWVCSFMPTDLIRCGRSGDVNGTVVFDDLAQVPAHVVPFDAHFTISQSKKLKPLQMNVRRTNDLAPLRNLGLQVFREPLRRPAHRLCAQRGEAVRHIALCDRTREQTIDFGDDRRRRARAAPVYPTRCLPRIPASPLSAIVGTSGSIGASASRR